MHPLIDAQLADAHRAERRELARRDHLARVARTLSSRRRPARTPTSPRRAAGTQPSRRHPADYLRQVTQLVLTSRGGGR